MFLESVLENLFKNSLEAFTEEGQINIDWIADATDYTLIVELSDNGPGIPPEMIDLLLSGKGVKTDKGEGSGIGMLTVKAMLDRINGKLLCESNLGQGTRWIITLELYKEEILDDILTSEEDFDTDLTTVEYAE